MDENPTSAADPAGNKTLQALAQALIQASSGHFADGGAEALAEFRANPGAVSLAALADLARFNRAKVLLGYLREARPDAMRTLDGLAADLAQGDARAELVVWETLRTYCERAHQVLSDELGPDSRAPPAPPPFPDDLRRAARFTDLEGASYGWSGTGDGAIVRHLGAFVMRELSDGRICVMLDGEIVRDLTWRVLGSDHDLRPLYLDEAMTIPVPAGLYGEPAGLVVHTDGEGYFPPIYADDPQGRYLVVIHHASGPQIITLRSDNRA